MPKKGEILWEVGKQLSKENWTRGEFVRSDIYQIPDICSLQIYFYPAGVSQDDIPTFKFVRTNTTLVSRKIKGNIQLYHLDTLAASFTLDHIFERGESEFHHHFESYLTLHRLKIFHSLPALSYLWRYIVFDPDPNEPELKPAQEPAPELQPALEPEPELQPAQEPAPELQLAQQPAPELQLAQEPALEPQPVPELQSAQEPALEPQRAQEPDFIDSLIDSGIRYMLSYFL